MRRATSQRPPRSSASRPPASAAPWRGWRREWGSGCSTAVPRSVSLTEEGRRFHAQVLPLLAGLEEAASEAAGAAATVSGRLRVNVDPWFARMILAPRIPQFLDAHPKVTLELTVSNHREEMMTG